jgi:hypothetical protein
MRIIRASEIGAFLYCQRAWWYQQQGEPSENQDELAGGTAIHHQHGKTVITTGCLRVVAYTILLLAVALVVFYLTIQLI